MEGADPVQPSFARARCLFDLDGVLTPTAKVHAAAWKEMIDEYLRAHDRPRGAAFVPFDAIDEYDRYVDGKPRADGTRSFLVAREAALPGGGNGLRAREPEERDRPAVAQKKSASHRTKAQCATFVRFATAASTAVVSSSRNCRLVLASAGITDLFGAIVDGVVARDMKLGGKPAPDTYLAAARMLEVSAEQAAVFEDALSGVETGRAVGFGFVVGVDQKAELLHYGASVVVKDLAELVEAALRGGGRVLAMSDGGPSAIAPVDRDANAP